jgi:ATP-dependent DNA helicase RecG
VTNQFLGECSGQPVSKAATTSQVIAATIEAGLIKVDEAVGGRHIRSGSLPPDSALNDAP